MMNNEDRPLPPKVTLKFLRCVEFTLPDGRCFTAKLLGPSDQSILDAKEVVAAFDAAKSDATRFDEGVVAGQALARQDLQRTAVR